MTDHSGTPFDPALTGSAEEGIFGIATDVESARLIYVPVPWDVTTSYGKGASRGPEAIRQASPQLDFFIPGLANHYQSGFHLLDDGGEIAALNGRYGPIAEAIQAELESKGELWLPALIAGREEINGASARVNDLVYARCAELDDAGKHIAVIGGDHSSPFGLIRFLSEKYRGDFGVLHIDAHLDLRVAYQGFSHSHASIMHNVMALDFAPRSLVQVGIRDFSEEEWRDARDDHRIEVFYDDDIREAQFGGQSFASLVAGIIDPLPVNVYVSFDIDGLKPNLAPHTGTPVPGGLEFQEAVYLIRALVRSGRRIIGFDLCEVCPNLNDPADEWDGNVGARMLFQLSSWMIESRLAE